VGFDNLETRDFEPVLGFGTSLSAMDVYGFVSFIGVKEEASDQNYALRWLDNARYSGTSLLRHSSLDLSEGNLYNAVDILHRGVFAVAETR
jgi:hypothetical protein